MNRWKAYVASILMGKGAMDPIITYAKGQRMLPVAVRGMLSTPSNDESLLTKRFGSYDALFTGVDHDNFNSKNELERRPCTSAIWNEKVVILRIWAIQPHLLWRPLPMEAKLPPAIWVVWQWFYGDWILAVPIWSEISQASKPYTGPYDACYGTLLAWKFGKGRFYLW